MKKRYFCLSLLGITAFLNSLCSKEQASLPYQNADLPVQERIDDLISRMTLDEKIAQMTLFNDQFSFVDPQNQFLESNVRKMLKNGGGLIGFISQDMKADEFAITMNRIQRILKEETRLGIPGLMWGEGLHGFEGMGGTSFPSPMGIASSWDTSLVREIYSVIAKEARVVGISQLYDPVLGLAREPRWGRIGETYGEDPFLVSQIAKYAIIGYQGTTKDIDGEHVAATAKHYAAHSQPEGGNNISPGNFSERILRENFFYPFEIAVKEAKVKSIMPSYNEIDGIPSHASTWLLEDILRGEWGFDGYIIGDLGGIEELYTVHNVASNAKEAAKLALIAGVDMDPVKKSPSYNTLVELLENEEINESLINKAVGRILKLKYEMGLFENPYVDPARAVSVFKNEEHDKLALKAAEEAMVLLKNKDDILPLKEENLKNIAIIGPNAAEIHLGSYSTEPFTGVSVLSGIQNYAGGKFDVTYAEGCKISVNKATFWGDGNVIPNSLENDEKLIAEAVIVAKEADVVLLVVGGNESTSREAWSESHLGDRSSLNLFGNQDKLVEAMIATGKPIIALLLNERPLAVNHLADHADALFEGWFLGNRTGDAVANVIFGKVNPSGKLTVTIPGSVGQLPCYYNRKPSRLRSYINKGSRLFPFGFGLSYTTFEYAALTTSPKQIDRGQEAKVSVRVKNTGTRPGEEIVQLYIRDNVSSVTRPVKELKGFQKISLDPGESKELTFTITSKELQFYNREMKRVVEPGEFTIMVGSHSESVLSSHLIVN